MKRILFTIAGAALLGSSCIDMMEDVRDVQKAEPVEVAFQVSATTQFIPKDGEIVPDPDFSPANIDVTFTNQRTSQKYHGTTDSQGIVSIVVDPGVYNIGASGVAEHNGAKYLINGTISSISLVRNISREEAAKSSDRIVVRPSKVGSLVLSEIYYNGCGADNTAQNTWFRDQTYRIYNNGDKVEYLDGLCFAHLFPNKCALPSVYPDEDGTGNFVYAISVWKIPGSGTDYPLQPGESVVIVQEAADHTRNNSSSYDNSAAEWECNTGNSDRDNAAVDNMPYIYYPDVNRNGQWLTSVFGPAFAIYRSSGDIVLDEEYYRLDGPNVQSPVGNKYDRLAKIPVDWIIDGVEAVGQPNELNKKRIPGSVDAGAVALGGTYLGKTVSRKVLSTRADGTPIYQDTNNSTDDFQENTDLVLRRNGEKVPAWSKNR